MRKNHSSEGILVFDRYYTKKPNAALLVLQRILFCGFLSASAMLFVFSQFGFPVSLVYIGLLSGFSAAVFLLISTFIGRRFTALGIGVITSFIIYFNFEEFWKRFSFFVDEAMLLVDGRFLFPKGYLLHDINSLNIDNANYGEGMLLGCGILCCLYGLLCAFSLKRRIHTLPALVGFIALCVPRLLAECFEFNLWFVPAALFFAAAAAIELNYRNGLAVTRNGSSAYRMQVRGEERNFNKAAKKAPFLKRIGMRASFYSKYATSGVCCVAVFALAFAIGAGIFQEGSSIDYTELYNTIFVQDSADGIGDGDASDDVVSDYFSSPGNDTSDLNITSPGKGDKSIIKVAFTGDNNIYLRGDIGVDFTGTGWTTPVESTSQWNGSEVWECYRPAEILVLRAVLDALDITDVTGTSENEITIDYLLQTDVVFLPSYTADFSYYNNPAFEVYGDFCVRVSESAGSFINSVHCTAISHDFSGNDKLSDAQPVDVIEAILKYYSENNITMDDLYTSVVPEMEHYRGADRMFSSYSDYVYDTYLDVPEYLTTYLNDYIREHDIENLIKYKGSDRSLYYFSAATAISDYLSQNYTYSLSGENRGEYALIQFLNESKSGHCSLYASAMTLLLRELDIPARYCTGFSIYPAKINGNTVELKERNLHAWVEVYIDELGWVTFDPTAAAVSENVIYDGSSSDTPQPPLEDTKEEPDTTETKEDFKPEHEDDGTSPDNKTDNEQTEDTFKIPTYMIVIVACSLALIAVVVLLAYKYRAVKKRAEDALTKDHRSSFNSIYNTLIDIFYLFDIRPQSGNFPSDYYADCDKVFVAGISDNIPLLEKAAFGDENATEAEMLKLAEILRRVYSTACKRSSPWRKYKIRKIVSLLKYTK